MAEHDAPEETDTTVHLLARFRAGDPEALNRLFARYLPGLRRWASGRLPIWARDATDTHDVVQDTLLQTFKKMEGFEHRGEGALRGYLQQALMNRIRDEIRKAGRRPQSTDVSIGLADDGTSPFESAIGAEVIDRYEAALQRLTPDERDAVIGRVELRLTYAELAQRIGKPSTDAARMAVVRALVRLAEEMGHVRTGASTGSTD